MSRTRRTRTLALLAALALALAGCSDAAPPVDDHDHDHAQPPALGPRLVPVEGVAPEDVPPPLGPVELGVTVVADRLREPARVAFAPDGMPFIGTEDGRLIWLEGRQQHMLARLAEGERMLGLAVDPAFPRRPYVYALVAGDASAASEVRRFMLLPQSEGGAGAEEPSVTLAALAVRPAWPGNALAAGPGGGLYAALGGMPGDVDADALAAALLAGTDVQAALAGYEAPCVAEGGGDGPWQAVPQAGSQPVTAGQTPAPAWIPAGAVAAVAYGESGTPAWSGSVFVVTAQGYLLRVPADGEGCPDLAAVELIDPEALGPVRDVAQGPDGHLYALTAPSAERAADQQRLLRIGPIEELGLLYPDLQTRPPDHLMIDFAYIDGSTQVVLRFTNVVVNLGEGPLEVRMSGDGHMVVQRVYAEDGSFLERPAGRVVDHWSHGHWHFEHFNRFELWERSDYEAFLQGARDVEPAWVEDKVSMCLMDLTPHAPEIPGHPELGYYGDACAAGEQGISVGWADIYVYDITEQWVVLGADRLGEGEYVLRSIVDSEYILHESPGGRDATRDSRGVNSGATWFKVEDGRLTVTLEESGGSEG